MNVLPHQIETLLTSVSSTISQNEKIRELRGETFNLFSIMQMETAENKTHSNIICELLNSKGSHRNGNIYLKLFLDMFCQDHLDLDSTQVKTEFSIGNVDIDRATGGRIDVYLWDNQGKTICIENKIHAPDQEKQIERYYNHNTSKNKVLYLNLLGAEPCDNSKGVFNSSEHFKIISYQKDILAWLEICLKESTDQPILRESIKQYYILIKKLTNTMDNQFNIDIKKLMISNIEATEYIRDNANTFLDEIKSNFRAAVVQSLRSKLELNFEVVEEENISSRYSKIWILPKSSIGKPLFFGIESFSGDNGANLQGDLFIGVFNQTPEMKPTLLNEVSEMSDYWLHNKKLEIDNQTICMRTSIFLKQIVDETSIDFKLIVDKVVAQSVAFIESNKEWVEKVNDKLLIK